MVKSNDGYGDIKLEVIPVKGDREGPISRTSCQHLELLPVEVLKNRRPSYFPRAFFPSRCGGGRCHRFVGASAVLAQYSLLGGFSLR